jgi:hypothetical protein
VKVEPEVFEFALPVGPRLGRLALHELDDRDEADDPNPLRETWLLEDADLPPLGSTVVPTRCVVELGAYRVPT